MGLADYIKKYSVVPLHTVTTAAIVTQIVKTPPTVMPLAFWAGVDIIVCGSFLEYKKGWRQLVPLAVLNMDIIIAGKIPSVQRLKSWQTVITVCGLADYIITRFA